MFTCTCVCMDGFKPVTHNMCVHYATAAIWVHDGHCAGGHLTGQNTCASSLEACVEHCKSAKQCGYIAYTTNKCDVKWGNCGLYDVAAGCPDDDQLQEFNAYRVQRGLLGILHISVFYMFYICIYVSFDPNAPFTPPTNVQNRPLMV